MPHDVKNQLLKIGDQVVVGKVRGEILDIKGLCQCVVRVPGNVILAAASQLKKVA